jgi:8-amino-3,8-dideoxy-alpha-D-manno-octulosonate transaminase
MAATLEREFAAWLGVPYTLAVSSGTTALELVLAAWGIGPGDEVIVPAWSWLSCLTAIIRVGARPVLAEIDGSLCLDPAEISRLTTPRTRAVLVVHFQGVAADLDTILHQAHRRGLYVLEDVAEAPGATYHGRRLGAWGDAAIFSFQHNKPMTAGEGGLVATRDLRTYERAVRRADLGQYRPIHHAVAPPHEPMPLDGGNARMSELTAAVALAQFRRLDTSRTHVRALRDHILPATANLPGWTWRPQADPTGDWGFELYASVATPAQADAARAALTARGVNCLPRTGTYPHYRRDPLVYRLTHHPATNPFHADPPGPLPGYRAEDFPRTEDLIHRLVALPLGARYTHADADHIVSTLHHISAAGILA